MAWAGWLEEALERLQVDGGLRVSVGEELMRAYTRGTQEQAAAVQAERRQEIAQQDDTDAVSELRGWWEQTAHDEVAGVTSKMVEYGGLSRATDLTDIGRQLVAAGVKVGDDGYAGGAVREARLQELGAYFYLVGKFARWTAAVAEGRAVSDDTLLDIGIYVRMAQRIRAVGGWPV